MSKDKAVDYFDRHQSSNECYITSDGRVFHTLGAAQSFAAGLKDNKLASYKRAELETPKDEAPKDEAPKDEATKVEALETLKTFDTAAAGYEDIKALAKALNLESPSNSKVDLIAAIEAQKAIINTEVKE